MSAPDCAVFGGGDDQPLCNLYSVTKGQQAIRELAGAMRDRTGNLPPLYGIFPDYSAPIVRNQPEGRELTMARWGMPSPVFALKGEYMASLPWRRPRKQLCSPSEAHSWQRAGNRARPTNPPAWRAVCSYS